MRANPVDKDALATDSAPLRRIFTRSIVAARPLAAGTVIGRNDVRLKKPGTGLAPDRMADVVGRTLRRDVQADALLAVEDIEGLSS
jgi:N,N'-diacetyllegionaminate synthase